MLCLSFIAINVHFQGFTRYFKKKNNKDKNQTKG